MRPSSENFVTQEQLRGKILNLEKRVAQKNTENAEKFVSLRRDVNSIKSQGKIWSHHPDMLHYVTLSP
jgi:hypothetical protein